MVLELPVGGCRTIFWPLLWSKRALHVLVCLDLNYVLAKSFEITILFSGSSPCPLKESSVMWLCEFIILKSESSSLPSELGNLDLCGSWGSTGPEPKLLLEGWAPALIRNYSICDSSSNFSRTPLWLKISYSWESFDKFGITYLHELFIPLTLYLILRFFSTNNFSSCKCVKTCWVSANPDQMRRSVASDLGLFI